MVDWQGLRERLTTATGADAAVDAALATGFGVPPDDFTASVDKCRALVAAALPGWKLHVGYNATGLFPYAAVTLGSRHVEAEAPSLPLAILRALVAAQLPPPPADPAPPRSPPV